MAYGTMHHLTKLRTVRMDWVRRCPIQSVDPEHYREDGSCACPHKITRMTKEGLLKERPLRAYDQDVPKTIISTIFRAPPGRTEVRH